MPTAHGSFGSDGGDWISAQCIIGDTLYVFAGSSNPPTPRFAANNANVEYASLDDLTSACSFTGTVGTNRFSFTFDNGVKASGDLKPPGVAHATSVEGKGEFQQT